MSNQTIRDLVGQVLKEHLSPDTVKDLESTHGHVNELSEQEQSIASEAFSSIQHIQTESQEEFSDFRGENVQLNTPLRGECRDYMAYIQKEGRTVKVHFDAKES
ncbi:MAG: hypothetical protein P8J32_03355 [bacterium]|nr:hypothetical protein [bacterium]